VLLSDAGERIHRAGEPITDLCRACKADRNHTVVAVDGSGRVLRVTCDFCGSQHNYRGGPGAPRPAPGPEPDAEPEVPTGGVDDHLESLLRRVLREELGLTRAAPAPKWRGGQMVLRPGQPGLQERSWPIDALFHKVVMIRNRLRTLEQQLNAADIPEDLKLRLQAYVSGCYGSLTSFNVLFADEADRFHGSGTD
jgi:hypothetical protein